MTLPRSLTYLGELTDAQLLRFWRDIWSSDVEDASPDLCTSHRMSDPKELASVTVDRWFSADPVLQHLVASKSWWFTREDLDKYMRVAALSGYSKGYCDAVDKTLAKLGK